MVTPLTAISGIVGRDDCEELRLEDDLLLMLRVDETGFGPDGIVGLGNVYDMS